jgi:hypothetical protein
LFAATGLALPLYAFPVLHFAGRGVDLATIFASLYVAVALWTFLRRRQTLPVAETVFLIAALVVLLLVLLFPLPELFSKSAFAVTYFHWALLVFFFLGALRLDLTDDERRLLLAVNVVVGTLVALYALYQVIGIPRGWPATGERLTSLQREPFRSVPIGGASPGGDYHRATSVFLEPSWMGGYLAGILAYCLGLLRLRPLGRGRALAVAAATVVIGAAILASVSWGAYVDALAVVAAAALAAGGASAKRRPLWAAALCAVIVAAGLLTPPGRSVGQALLARWRMFRATPLVGQGSPTDFQDSSGLRLKNAVSVLGLWREHPIGGLGLGYLDRFRKGAPATEAEVVHSGRLCGWVSIAAEAGVFGPVVLAAALTLVLTRARRRRQKLSDPVVVALVVLAAVQQLHTGSYIDLWWWFPLSVAGALANRAASGNAPGEPFTP